MQIMMILQLLLKDEMWDADVDSRFRCNNARGWKHSKLLAFSDYGLLTLYVLNANNSRPVSQLSS